MYFRKIKEELLDMRDKMWMTTSAGLRMPRILYGTAWKKERTADLVTQAVMAGFRGIDTAAQPKHYDEHLVGQALQSLQKLGIQREELFLQTKFTPLQGQDPERVPYDINAPVEEQVLQSFAASQANLQTDHIDSFILHSPLAPHALLMKVWRAMESLHKEGRVSQLGISNCYMPGVLTALYDEAEIKPAVVQNRFYQQTGYDRSLRALCAEKGIIYQSFWTLTANPHILASGDVRQIAARLGKTEEQVFFRYLTLSGIIPLTGTTSREHMLQDLAIFDFVLSDTDMHTIDLLLS
jgi:diketogulonate reductase-like aldo/keto reductase